jgi:hypothetical protein
LADAYFFAYKEGQAGAEAIYQSFKYLDLILKHGPTEKHGINIYQKGKLCMKLYLKNRNNDDLDRAIAEFKAATRYELDQQDREDGIMELSRALSERYNHKRSIADLYDATQWAHVAVKENPKNLLALQNVADLLHWIYKETQDARALDKSIDYYEATRALYSPIPGKDGAPFHYRFGIALIRRFDRDDGHETLQDIEHLQDIERAVVFLRLAVAEASPQKLDRYQHCLMDAITRQNNLYASLDAIGQQDDVHTDQVTTTQQNDVHTDRVTTTQQNDVHTDRVTTTQQDDAHTDQVIASQHDEVHADQVIATQQDDTHADQVITTQQDDVHADQVTTTQKDDLWGKQISIEPQIVVNTNQRDSPPPTILPPG